MGMESQPPKKLIDEDQTPAEGTEELNAVEDEIGEEKPTSEGGFLNRNFGK